MARHLPSRANLFEAQMVIVIVLVDQHRVVEHAFEPVLQVFQLPKIDHKVIVVEFVTGEMESYIPVIPVDVPAVSIVVRLAVRTWQIVIRLGGGKTSLCHNSISL